MQDQGCGGIACSDHARRVRTYSDDIRSFPNLDTPNLRIQMDGLCAAQRCHIEDLVYRRLETLWDFVTRRQLVVIASPLRLQADTHCVEQVAATDSTRVNTETGLTAVSHGRKCLGPPMRHLHLGLGRTSDSDAMRFRCCKVPLGRKS